MSEEPRATGVDRKSTSLLRLVDASSPGELPSVVAVPTPTSPVALVWGGPHVWATLERMVVRPRIYPLGGFGRAVASAAVRLESLLGRPRVAAPLIGGLQSAISEVLGVSVDPADGIIIAGGDGGWIFFVFVDQQSRYVARISHQASRPTGEVVPQLAGVQGISAPQLVADGFSGDYRVVIETFVAASPLISQLRRKRDLATVVRVGFETALLLATPREELGLGGVTHGDLWAGNVGVADDGRLAVWDLEYASDGSDPARDFVHSCLYLARAWDNRGRVTVGVWPPRLIDRRSFELSPSDVRSAMLRDGPVGRWAVPIWRRVDSEGLFGPGTRERVLEYLVDDRGIDLDGSTLRKIDLEIGWKVRGSG